MYQALFRALKLTSEFPTVRFPAKSFKTLTTGVIFKDHLKLLQVSDFEAKVLILFKKDFENVKDLATLDECSGCQSFLISKRIKSLKEKFFSVSNGFDSDKKK